MKRISSDEHKRRLVLRLRRVEGQLRGIQRLIEEEATCESIAQQLAAARRALEKAQHATLGCMIETQLASRGVAPADVEPIVDLLARYG
jgi:CsoR family transcriptional regulator, copper-sensing transcriptional repressor